MTNQVFQATVESVEPLPNRNGKSPAWQVYVQGLERSVFSLKGAEVGETIYYDSRKSAAGNIYTMHLEKNGDSYDIAKTEALKADNASGKSSGSNSWGRKVQAPMSPAEAVSIYAQIAKETVDSGLAGYLINELNFSTEQLATNLTTLFIAASKERGDYELPAYPSASEVLGYKAEEPGSEDMISETDDLLEEL